ncbi:hypothetical protein J9893_06570 [Aeromonas sp. MaB10011B]|uniref:hypothetical protein n=1 Tax=unclassified Aeromonas TaxID=257493 RepID=UPI001B33E39A|nr:MULTISPECIES: hypothetical protein [unclassified Aeromonas]MBP4066652.1 hypothetical protein [Aeromonas sp. MaB10011B]MBP4079055.1 hypothetical protein [Aeromonas sp. MrichA-1]
MSNGTSTTPPQIPNSSSAQPTESQAWQKVLADASKPKTPAQIRAAGEVTVKVGVLWFVGATCVVLAAFGGAMFFYDANVAKDVWVIFGPIITAGITGTIGYLSGESKGSSK